jgi:hypothetical protein
VTVAMLKLRPFTGRNVPDDPSETRRHRGGGGRCHGKCPSWRVPSP